MTLWQGEFQIEAGSESEVLDTFLRLPGWHKVRVTVRNINWYHPCYFYLPRASPGSTGLTWAGTGPWWGRRWRSMCRGSSSDPAQTKLCWWNRSGKLSSGTSLLPVSVSVLPVFAQNIRKQCLFQDHPPCLSSKATCTVEFVTKHQIDGKTPKWLVKLKLEKSLIYYEAQVKSLSKL